MQGLSDGFIKLFCLLTTGIVVGGVVVAPSASELIHPIALAVSAKLTVGPLAQAFTVYPSLSGSIAELRGGCIPARRSASTWTTDRRVNSDLNGRGRPADRAPLVDCCLLRRRRSRRACSPLAQVAPATAVSS